MDTKTKMQSIIEGRSTSQLLDMLQKLEDGENTPDTRRVFAMIADVATDRLQINDALDEVFGNLHFDGTYLDAIKACIK